MVYYQLKGVLVISAWIRGGAAGACAPPEFSGFSTKHCDVPPRNFGDYLEILCFKQKCPPGIRSLIQALMYTPLFGRGEYANNKVKIFSNRFCWFL